MMVLLMLCAGLSTEQGLLRGHPLLTQVTASAPFLYCCNSVPIAYILHSAHTQEGYTAPDITVRRVSFSA